MLREMIEEYRYRKKKGIEHAHAWSRRQKAIVTLGGFVMLVLQTATALAALKLA